MCVTVRVANSTISEVTASKAFSCCKKFSHPPLLTPSWQLILPECSPHIDLCSSFNLITAASESLSPFLSQNSGRSCNFPLLPRLFLLPQQTLQGKEEWKPRSFSFCQPAERNRVQGRSGFILVSNPRNLRSVCAWIGLLSYMYCWFICFVRLVVDLLLDKTMNSGRERRQH